MTRGENIPWLKARLGSELREVLVQGDQPLLLDDPSSAYVTLSDHHQLFCVGFCDGRPRGRREHLARCDAGQVLFGLPPRADAPASVLMLSGVTGSRVWRLPVAGLLAQGEEPAGRARVAELFDRYIELLIATLPEVPVPSLSDVVGAGDMVDAQAERALHAAPGRLLWVAPHQTREYRGVSMSDVGVLDAECWPLTAAAWLLCAPGRFRVWTTEELLTASGGTQFAAGFCAFLVAVAGEKRKALAAERLCRDAASQRSERAQLEHVFDELAVVGNGQRLAAKELSGEAFARACQRIFAWLELEAPPRWIQPRSSAPRHVQAALDQLRTVRTRPVLLEERFWRSDAGPLLGFVVEDERQHPVALLPSARGYALYDPRAARTRELDATWSTRLDPHAHQFYRTLPREPLGALRLLRFCATRVGRDAAVVAALGLVGGLIGTLVPLFTGQLFDRIVPGAERGLLVQLVCVMLALCAGSFSFDVARGLALLRLQTRMDAALEAAVWDRLLNLPLPFFREYSAGDLAARALGIGTIRQILSDFALSSLLAVLFSAWNLALLFYFDLRLALVASGLVTIAALVAGLAAYYSLQRRRCVTEFDGRIAGLLLQLFTGIAKLRASGSENRAFAVWAKLFTRRRDADLGAERIGLRVAMFDAAFPLLCSAALYMSLMGERTQTLSTGQFLAFYAAFSAFLRAMLALIEGGLRALDAIPFYERTQPILMSPLESQGPSEPIRELRGAIEISHVSFRYAMSVPLALDDISLRIAAGEFVAIVGASGSGKSTLLRVLLGFESPVEGAVYYDGQALRGLDLRSVRQQIGVVLQHSQVVDGDIYGNIVGSSGLGIAEAWQAARQAAFERDIEAMPMGMHTIINAGGSSLSGGQRQRLLIARALATQPRILLFDEATSALDSRTQASVRESLDALRVTRVVIAHRLSTIRNADRIVVLERGRVVQSGSFDELLAQPGAFRVLAQRQLL